MVAWLLTISSKIISGFMGYLTEFKVLSNSLCSIFLRCTEYLRKNRAAKARGF